jgi:hypothetical protein
VAFQRALELSGFLCRSDALTAMALHENEKTDAISPWFFVAGCGRLLSMSQVGLPEPRALWLGYLTPELLLPWVLAFAHYHRPQV